MYILYVDESGDIGLTNSPTQYFCLSGFVVHELRWDATLSAIVDFRKVLKERYGLKLREEIHAAHFINSPGDLARIGKSMRLHILREVMDFQAQLPDINILNIIVNKDNKAPGTDIFDIAWQTLIQRFHNTVSRKNFPGPQNSDDRGLLFTDKTDEPKLRALSRRMRRFNQVPSRFNTQALSVPTTTIIEDAVHRDSKHSYFIQLCDVNAYFLYQQYAPSAYVKKKGAKNYITRLGSALCRVASSTHPLGIVER
jgi:Protein of unknown function (DUF3800)